MPLDLIQVRLEDLSDIRYSFWTGKHPSHSYERSVLVIRFEGTYRFGSGGNPDATFMRSKGEAAVEAFDPDALIIDLSALSYEWGDEMDSVFGISGDRKMPAALIVGEKCRTAIGTLLFGVDSTKDACEEAWVFDSPEAAWNFVTNLLDEGDTPRIHEAAKSGDIQRLKQVLESGEDPNRRDSSGLTPLHEATDPAIVRLLIEAGADVKAKNAHGITPLHLVKNYECAYLLLNAGADPDARSWTNSSPLDHVQSAEIAKLLIDAGADVHLRERSSLLHTVRRPELAKVFIHAGVNVNAVDENGRTPLDKAEESQQIYQRQAEQYGFTNHADQARQYSEIVALIRANGGTRSSR